MHLRRSHKPLVLIVEDDALVRALAAEIIADAGFRVIEAGDALEALEALETRPEVQVLLTDVDLPRDMDGFALTRFVAEHWPEIAILVTSGRMRPGHGDMPAGAVFLGKPFPPAGLVQQVEEAARRAQAQIAGRWAPLPEDACIAQGSASSAVISAGPALQQPERS